MGLGRCFGTHDTPTLRGYVEGRDIEWWHQLGWVDGEQAEQAKLKRQKEVQELAGLNGEPLNVDPDEPVFSDIADSVHQVLSQSPAELVSVQLDDIFGLVEAQNLPGTIDEHPNWRRRCPVDVSEFGSNPRLVDTGRQMARAARTLHIGKTMEESG